MWPFLANFDNHFNLTIGLFTNYNLASPWTQASNLISNI